MLRVGVMFALVFATTVAAFPIIWLVAQEHLFDFPNFKQSIACVLFYLKEHIVFVLHLVALLILYILAIGFILNDWIKGLRILTPFGTFLRRLLLIRENVKKQKKKD